MARFSVEVWCILGGIAAAGVIGIYHILAAEVRYAHDVATLNIKVEALRRNYAQAAKRLGFDVSGIEVVDEIIEVGEADDSPAAPPTTKAAA